MSCKRDNVMHACTRSSQVIISNHSYTKRINVENYSTYYQYEYSKLLILKIKTSKYYI